MKNIRKIFLFFLVMLMLDVPSSAWIEIGRGTSTDTLYGLEYSGLIWKTYSVYLTNDHPYEGHSAIYSIANNDIETIQKVQEAIKNKTKVKVMYKNELWVWPWDYSSDVVIYDIQEE